MNWYFDKFSTCFSTLSVDCGSFLVIWLLLSVFGCCGWSTGLGGLLALESLVSGNEIFGFIKDLLWNFWKFEKNSSEWWWRVGRMLRTEKRRIFDYFFVCFSFCFSLAFFIYWNGRFIATWFQSNWINYAKKIKSTTHLSFQLMKTLLNHYFWLNLENNVHLLDYPFAMT